MTDMPLTEQDWTIRGDGLIWVYDGELFQLIPRRGVASHMLPPRPARDVLRALLAYAIEQIDKASDRWNDEAAREADGPRTLRAMRGDER